MKQKLRRWVTVSLALVVAMVFAIGLSTADHQNVAHAAVKNQQRTLIVYFSMTGNTKRAAEQIHRYTGAKIVRLYRAKPYPKGYSNYARVANRERKNNIHPAIKKNLPNLDRYDTVLIGFPTWWQQPPMVIHTLFDDYNFRGKTIIPFTTSSSTPMKNSMPYMQRMGHADDATVKNGFRYDDNNAALKRFLNRNGLLNNH